ncbi:MAG TPA: alpha/beta fold hydrolase [Aggregatilineales bacterium]|nr:alpha/beta fold hydrolase [Aggregatilineales bacterium]
MRLPRRLLLGGGLLFGAWIAAVNVGAAYFTRRRAPDSPDSPANYGIGFQEIAFASRDRTRLFGRWIPANNPVGTVILCHGQEGSMDGLTPIMVPLYEAGFNVLMFDFRAHGRSEGRYVSMGVFEKEDLLGAIDYLYQAYGIASVGVLGFSMGAATALVAAALSDHIRAVVADSSFVDLQKTVQRWGMQRGVAPMIARRVAQSVLIVASMRMEGRLDQTDPLHWMPHIGPRPILLIYGGDDPYVTRAEMSQIESLAEGPVETWIVDGVGHRGVYRADPIEYTDRVVAWFRTYLALADSPS